MKTAVIGGGISGLASAAVLAQAGHEVTLFEKNEKVGGRAYVWQSKGFTFDMGPSWYMTPQFFERFFALFDKKPSDYYQLEKLDPAYSIWVDNNWYEFSTNLKVLKKQLEDIDSGSYAQFEKLLAEAARKYEFTDRKLLFQTFTDLQWLLDPEIWKIFFTGGLFHSYHQEVARYISHPHIQSALEFFTVFLGGYQHNMPAAYTQLVEMVFNQHIWYPMGGFGEVIEGFRRLAEDQGVKIVLNAPVEKLVTTDGRVTAVQIGKKKYSFDLVVSSAEIEHTENLLPAADRQFSKRYWESRELSPATLLVFLGLKKRLKNITHHTVVFRDEYEEHFANVFSKNQKWPEQVSYYVCAPSVTDRSIVPKGGEALMFLVPLSANLEPSEQENNRITDQVLAHFQDLIGKDLTKDISVKRVVAHQHFIDTFNAYKGGAFGLAHTYWQTAFLRPSIQSRKVKNLYFTGHYTLPGVGFPTALISGQIVGQHIVQKYQN